MSVSQSNVKLKISTSSRLEPALSLLAANVSHGPRAEASHPPGPLQFGVYSSARRRLKAGTMKKTVILVVGTRMGKVV